MSANHNSGTIQGSQNNVNGPYHDNSRTDRRQIYHYHSVPANNYSTTAYGSNIINGSFSGVQYNGIPPPHQPGQSPFLPMGPGSFTHEPGQMEDFLNGRAGGDNRHHHPYTTRPPSVDDILDAYDQPSANPQGGTPVDPYPPRPSQRTFQAPPGGYPAHTSPSYPEWQNGQGNAHLTGHQDQGRQQSPSPRNPNYRSRAMGGSFAPDPFPRGHHQSFNSGNEGFPSWNQNTFDRGAGYDRAESPSAPDTPRLAKPCRQETNPFRRTIKDEEQNPQKATTYCH